MNIKLNYLYLCTSFYGVGAWVFSLVFFQFRLTEVYDLSFNAWVIFGYVVLIFFVLLIFEYKLISQAEIVLVKPVSSWTVELIFHSVGYLGAILYLTALSTRYGGFASLIELASTDILEIRVSDPPVESAGIILTYFGWVGMYISTWKILVLNSSNRLSEKLSRSLRYFAVVSQFSLNLVFIDRTRPMWHLFTLSMLILAFLILKKKRDVTFIFIVIVALFLLFFNLFIYVTGKSYSNGSFWGEIYVYLGPPLAYFDALLNTYTSYQYLPVRLTYPVGKVLSIANLTSTPPPQVLDFISTPSETNVGTFIEPYFSDGGYVYVFLVMPFVMFLTSCISVLALKRNQEYGIMIWACLCFSNAISIFVPKSTSTQLWLFALIWVVSLLASKKNSKQLL